jgi:predicted kinase
MANESLIRSCTPSGVRKIVVLRGLPGSGKSTFALNAVHTFPGLVARVNNDDLATAIFGKSWTPEVKHSSLILQGLRTDIVDNLFRHNGVEIIIIDNTNLNRAAFTQVETLAKKYDAEFIIDDTFLEVPIEECIRRDSLRESPVGEKVIRMLAKQLERK